MREGEREQKPRKRFADNDPFAREIDDKKEKPVKTGTTFKKELEDSERRYKKGDMATKKPFAGIPERKKSREDYRKETRISEKDEFRKAVQDNDRDYFGDDDEWEVEGDKRPKMPTAASYPMPLNKYIAHSGECSRRDAAELVKQGKVKVNGELITEPGHKINQEDKVTLSGKKLTPQKGLIYVLLNKPKGFITTNEDERGRKTVMDLVANADASRLFPVGRLDRATTGLLLLTNDGDLTQKLSHPSFNIKKVYHVTLDKPLTKADFEKVMSGIELEDGKAEVDEMAYLEAKNELGLEIHSGKNRIVRRIFESMGYVVEKLDRMMYAGLTKKNLPRGKWRYLNEQEIVLLKHFKS
jgi:23S rRNA pseudouridine2605 synthase